MDRNTLHKRARKLMDEHGLTEWKIKFSRSKSLAGLCSHRTRTLTFSLECAAVFSEEETMDTITHEIAHAIVGPSHKHDYVWRAKHMELGGSGREKWNNRDAVAAMALWVGTCPNGHTYHRNARSEKMTRVSCTRCSGRYNPEYHFEWRNTKTGEIIARVAGQTQAAVSVAALDELIKNALAASRVEKQTPAPAAPSWEKGFTDIEALFAGD